ncbi:RDD family protein [Agaribacter flavus]|uniref:RDD family protein n=1 Tax=Agaribacter flavus TaxID=1902781 RepID=A0ABV7FV90_9ALTE
MVNNSTNIAQRAGFLRRLAAMVYDTLIAIAIAVLSGLVIVSILAVLMSQNVIPNFGYEHLSESIQASIVLQLLVQLWMVFWVVLFYLWFWKHGGQTLGMRAWRLRMYTLNPEQAMGYWRLFIRLILAFGGLGTLLVLFDYKNKQSLQDRLSGTEVLFLSKEENHHKSW